MRRHFCQSPQMDSGERFHQRVNRQITHVQVLRTEAPLRSRMMIDLNQALIISVTALAAAALAAFARDRGPRQGVVRGMRHAEHRTSSENGTVAISVTLPWLSGFSGRTSWRWESLVESACISAICLLNAAHPRCACRPESSTAIQPQPIQESRPVSAGRSAFLEGRTLGLPGLENIHASELISRRSSCPRALWHRNKARERRRRGAAAREDSTPRSRYRTRS